MQLAAKEAYKLWAPTYDGTSNPLLQLEERVLAPLLPMNAATRIVDVGCGTGRGLERHRRWTAVGIDACEEMLTEAGTKGLRGKLACADACALPIASSWADCIICSFAAAYFGDLAGALLEMARVTQPGGKLLLTELHPEAAARGWKRSFRADGRSVEIEHSALTEEAITFASRRAGWRMTLRQDCWFSLAERSAFLAAGREDLLAAAYQVPAIRIGVYEKL